jgi:hypothetical protein
MKKIYLYAQEIHKKLLFPYKVYMREMFSHFSYNNGVGEDLMVLLSRSSLSSS